MLPMTAISTAVAGSVCAATLVAAALYPSLHQRWSAPAGAFSDIPLYTHLSFDLRSRLQRYVLWVGGVSSQLEQLPDVAALAPNVIRILGGNPSRMTLRGTNTYLIGAGSSRILIDASDGNAGYVETLLRVCAEHNVTEISDVLLTHGHYDHMGGIMRVKQAFPNVCVWKHLPPNGDDRRLRVNNDESRRLGIRHLEDGAAIQVQASGASSAQIRAVFTPGHYDDHMCFLLEEGERCALFSGDCILGEGSCVFDSLHKLMKSLVLLRAAKPTVIFPGHGPVVHQAVAKIDEYMAHRQQREDEILQVLEQAAAASGGRENDASLSAAEIVQRIYEKLPYLLQLAARKAVDKHLHKLMLEKRVEQQTNATWTTAATYRLAQINAKKLQ